MPHPLLEIVFHSFTEAGVRWCLLRGEADLDTPSGDIDLLVDPIQLNCVRQMLLSLKFAPLKAWGRGSHNFFLCYHPPTDHWIELDIVTELSFGPHFTWETGAARGCLARRQRSGDVCTLAPDDGFWTLLFHCLLDKGRVSPQHAAWLAALVPVARPDGPLAEEFAAICPARWLPIRVIRCVERGQWDELARFAPILAAAILRRHPFRTAWRTLLTRAARSLEKPLIMRQRRGLSVALLGPDGAGKSTLAAGVQRSFYFPVRSVYMGLWPRGPAKAGTPWATGWEIALRPFKIWWRYLTAQYHQARGRLVIFDRYTYDALLPPAGRFVALKRAYFWMLAHACPAPDLVMVLDAPGQVMYARKGEDNPAQLEAQRRHFLALGRHIAHLQVIDVTRGADDVRADVMARIWQRYATRLSWS